MTARSAVVILDLLERADVPTWVAGGWGVDALVGQESRPHADLDLLIPEPTSSRARQSLAAAGFVDSLDELPTRFEMAHQKWGVVDLHPIHDDTNGNPWLPLPNGASWVYTSGALDGHGQIESRRCRCLSAHEQLRLHDGYELREIDHADIRLLRSLPARRDVQPGSSQPAARPTADNADRVGVFVPQRRCTTFHVAKRALAFERGEPATVCCRRTQ